MQGQLEKEFLSVEIETKCRHCDRELHLTIDSDLHITLQENDASPRLFLPDVDWARFTESTIIDTY